MIPAWIGTDLKRLWIGQLLLRTTWAVLLVAGAFVIKNIEESPVWNAWLVWMLLAPGLLANPLAGVAADRLHPHVPITVAGMLLAAAMGAVAVTAFSAPAADATATVLLVAAGVASLALAFYGPAEDVLLAAIVPRQRLPTAYAVDEGLGHLAELVGSAAAGAALVAAGAGAVFGGITIVALVATCCSLGLRHRRPPAPTEPVGRSLRTGLRHLWQTPGLLIFRGLLALVLATVVGVSAMLPFYVEDHLGRDASWMPTVALITAVSGILGMSLAGRCGCDGGRRAWQVPVAVLGLSAGCLALGRIQATGPALVAIGICAMSLGFCIIQARTLALMSSPESLRGRVMSWMDTIDAAAALVVVPLIGHGAERLAVADRVPVVLSCAAAGIGVVALMMVVMPTVRRHLALRLGVGHA